MSRPLVRERAMKSHSSRSKTQGRSLAASNTVRRFPADSPKSDESKASNLTFINGKLVFHARRFAPSDLPQPGGP